MNTKIAFRGLSILSALALMGGATFAYFSDTASSNGNVFSAGTLSMLLSDDNETDLTEVLATWGATGMEPGVTTFTGDLKIKNTGTTPANHVELKVINSVTEGSDSGAVATIPLDSVIEITSLLWDTNGDGSPEQDLLPAVTDTNSNTFKDLDDLGNQLADDFDDLAFGGTQGNDHVLRIAGKLHSSAENQHQGDEVSTLVEVTMNQDASQ